MNTRQPLDIRRFALAMFLLLLASMLVDRALPAQLFTPTRFTVVDAGSVGKPDVILIPGLNSSRAVWEAEAKLLATNYRLHLVQIGGFAGEPAGANASGPMLPAITEELHSYIAARRMHPAVIGHSLGGLLALMLADRHPADVSKMVIVDAFPFYGALMGPDATVATVKPQMDAMGERMRSLPEDQYAAMMPMMAAGMVTNPEGQKQVAAWSQASDRGVSIKAFQEDASTDLRGDVSSIQTKTLLLYPYFGTAAGADPASTDTLYAGAYKAMPNVTLQRIDASRHFLMLDQPAQFDTAVEAFLGK